MRGAGCFRQRTGAGRVFDQEAGEKLRVVSQREMCGQRTQPLPSPAGWWTMCASGGAKDVHMRLLTIVYSVALLVAPSTGFSQGVATSTPSLVLTPQAIERFAGPAREQHSLKPDDGLRRWSSTQHMAVLWSTAIACTAIGSGCAAMPPMPTLLTPPGGEAWRLAGCKSAETCNQLWKPSIPLRVQN